MELKLKHCPGTLASYSDPEKDSRFALKIRFKLEGPSWAAFEKLCPGLTDLAKLIAAEEEVGAQHIHCHTKIDPIDIIIATRESDDPSVDPVTQMSLDECEVKGAKSAVIMLDREGEGVVALTVLKRVEKKLVSRLRDLKGADLYFTTEPRQPNLPLEEKTAA